MNGAVVTASSPNDLNASGDDLINSALKQAVFQAITEMKTRPAVKASVILAKGDQIFTNSSTRGGIVEGMKMVAVRDNERIAEVLITDANATGADGKVVSGSQLRTGDYLMALFELPGTACPPTVKEQVVHHAKSLEPIGILALAGLIVLGQASRQLLGWPSGNYDPGNFQVSGLANGEALGYSIPPPVGWILTPASRQNLLTWTKYSNTQSNRVVGYWVFRNEQVVDLIEPPDSPGNSTYLFRLWAFPASGHRRVRVDRQVRRDQLADRAAHVYHQHGRLAPR